MSGSSFSTPRYVRTCRACLGSGCVHCNNHGQVRERVFRRKDGVAEGLRALLLGTTTETTVNTVRVKEPANQLKELIA